MRKVQKVLLLAFGAGILLCGIGTGVALVEYSSFDYEGTKVLGEDQMVTRDFDYEIDGDTDEVLLLRLDSFMARYMSSDSDITADQIVPPGTVRYRITYNESLVSPELTFIPYDKDNDGTDVTDPTVDALDGTDVPNMIEESAEDAAVMDEESPEDTDAAVMAEESPEDADAAVMTEESDRPSYMGELRIDFWSNANEFDVIMENKDMILENLKHGKIASYDIASIGSVEILANPKTLARVETAW